MNKTDFYFYLPERLIAQTPLEKRDTSRLLHLDKTTGEIEHRHFYDVKQYLRKGDCLVLNDSRVLPARLIGARPTGGSVELVLLKDLGEGCWECLSRPGRKTKPGQEIIFGNGELTATVQSVTEGGNRIVKFHFEGGMAAFHNNYNYVYNEWLPQHPEYKAVMAVNVEWYTMGDFNSPDYKCGVMIPVE